MADDISSSIKIAMTEATSGKSFRRWYGLIKAVAIAVPVVGAIPTATNLYYSFQHDIPFSQVSHKLSQYDLWVKNADCRIDYHEIATSKGTAVNVGACPSTGDISIRVSLASGKSTYEWIPFGRLQQASASAMHLFVGRAYAAEAPAAPAGNGMRVAQMGHVVCQGWEGTSKIVRIINEGGKCYRETISPYQGNVAKREEVPCNTTCPRPHGK